MLDSSKRRQQRLGLEPLEDRILLSLGSRLDQVFPTGPKPLAVQIGQIDGATPVDLAVLGADGQLTVALNSGQTTWQSVTSVDLGVGPASGLALGRFDTDLLTDVVIQGPSALTLARGDGTGRFTVSQTIIPGAAGVLAPRDGGTVQLAAALLDNDSFTDLATVAPGSNEVLVFKGSAAGLNKVPERYASGASQPVAVVAGNFLGGPWPDLAVGHRDGTVTFLEGQASGRFDPRPEFTVTGLGRVAALAAADLDGDADLDLVVSGGTQVSMLVNSGAGLTTTPVVNSDFSAGLTGWTANGPVSASNSFAQLREGPELLTTLQQTFVVPAGARELSFDLVALALEAPAGALPDAFEVSLLDSQQRPLVPTVPQGTAFLNVNPGGVVTTARGVTFDGRHATLDLSGLPQGASVTLAFDLIGNPPGNGSVVSVANVQVSAAPAVSTFRRVALAGPFGATAGVATGDVDGDGRLDLVVADGGLNRLLVYNGDGNGGFTRSDVDLARFGTGALAVGAGQLTVGDTSDDVVLTLSGSARALSPLAFDNVPPQATVLAPSPGQIVTVSPTRIQLRFSEAMRNAGAAASHSVTNPASYALSNLADGRRIAFTSVSWNATTFEVTLVPSARLTDGSYQLTIDGTGADLALQDLVGNALGGGADTVTTFRVDTVPPRVQVLNPLPGQLANTSVSEVRLSYSEAVRDTGPTGLHSASNPASYSLLNTTTGQSVTIASVRYDAATFQAVLVLAPGSAPLADGKYQLVIKGKDASNAIQDLAGNSLGGGVDTTVVFTVDAHAPEVKLVLTPNILWPPNHQLVEVQAKLTLSDAVDSKPRVTLLSITSNEPDVSAGTGNFANDIQNAAFGTDDRKFSLRAERSGEGPGRIYTITYFVQDAAGNGRVVSGVVIVPHDQGTAKAMLDAIGDPTLVGLGELQTIPTLINDPPINVGDVVADAIAVAGEVDVWTFQGVAGQRIFFDAQAGSSSAFHWALTDPKGNVLFSDSFRDHDTLALPLTGEYALTIDGPKGQTGNYQFKLWNVPAPVVAPITIGQVVSGSIGVPGEENRYTFQGNAGQRLFFDVQNASVFRPLGFSLLRPDGSLLLSMSAGDRDVFVLPTSGTYTVVVGDVLFLDDTGNYQFQIDEVPTTTLTPITFGQAISGTLGVPGEEDRYTFTATAGQKLYFDVQGTLAANLTFTLLRPDGTPLFSRLSSDQGPFIAPMNGTYTVVVGHNSILDAKGAYQFAIFDVLTPPSGIGIPDSKGTDFWLAFPGAVHDLVFTPGEVSLLITAAEDTTGQISFPAIGFFTNFSVKGGAFTTFTFPTDLVVPDPELSVSDRIENKGIHVTATREVTVYGLNHIPRSTDAYLGLPTDALGTEYIVLGYKNVRAASDPSASIGNSTQFAIVGTVDGTKVTITPAVTTGTHAARVPYTITLGQGQTYLLRNSDPTPADLSGTIITSDKPIAVLGGHAMANIPQGSSSPGTSLYGFADQLVEQLPSVDTWGRRFETMPFATRLQGDTFRFLAARDATTVRVNGAVVATLNRGQVHEMLLTGPAEITADQPILVAQYANGTEFDGMTGDPDMMLVPAQEQWLASCTLTTAPNGFPDLNYVNVITPTAGVGAVLLDGVAIPAGSFMPVGSGGFFGAQVAVAPGTHHLDSPLPFNASIYGIASRDSYSFSGAASMSPVARAASLALTPATATRSLATEHRVSAVLKDVSGTPLRGVRVDFQVKGANQAAGFSLTDGNGRAEFAYIGTNPGSDSIVAAQGSLTATASATWAVAAPTVSLVSPSDGSSVQVGSILVTGLVRVGSPLTTLASVTVNGQRVETIDAAGNFFTRVSVVSGTNAFTFTATDNLGQATSATLTLAGTDQPAGTSDFSQLQDVTALGRLDYQAVTYNRRTHTLYARAQLTNGSNAPLDGPVLVNYRFIPATVTLASPDGASLTGQPFLSFDTELGPLGLAPGATSGQMVVGFTDPNEARFALGATLLAQGNVPPAFSSVPVTTAVVGRSYSYAALVADPNGQRLAYRLEVGPVGMTLDPTTGLVSWTPMANQVGMNQVILAVSDGRGGTARQQFSIAVTAAVANRAPVFASVPPTQSLAGADYRYSPQVADADGDPLRFFLDVAPAGATVDPGTGRLSFPAAPAGAYPMMLRVEDGRGGSAVQSWVLSVGNNPANNPPVLLSFPSAEAVVGTPYVYQAQATDADGQPLRFALLAAPTGMAVDAVTGRVSWSPTIAQVGSRAALLQVSDGAGGIAVQAFTITVYAVRPNRAPVIDSQPPLLATQDHSYSYAVSAHDPDGDSLRYELLIAPPNMTIGASTGVINWMPTAANVGGYRVQVRVVDALGAVALQTYDLAVRPSNVAPVVTGFPGTLATVGVPYRGLVTATDVDVLSFSLINAPAGLTINANSGLVSWVPAPGDLGSHAVRVRVSDERGAFTDASFSLNVMADTEAPVVSVVASPNLALPGEEVVIRVVASDNASVATLGLLINGTPVALDANHTARFTPSNPGIVSLAASATDRSGNTGTGTARLRVLDPSDSQDPLVQIISPSDGAVVTGRVNIVGTVTDPNLDFYRVEYARVGTDTFTTFAQGNTSVSAGVLGTLDTTRLDNDAYVIRVTAFDVNGNGYQLDTQVSIQGENKLGRFRQEVTDLTVPVTGIPITITRVYDTLDTDQSGDFGFGWSLGVADARIRETVPPGENEDLLGLFAAHPFRAGTRVYLTGPAGQRVGFTFDPVAQATTLGTIWHPRFTADPGVYDTLTVDDAALTQNKDGTFRLFLFEMPYNPDVYRLTTRDGVTYRYDQFKGLQDATDRNGNVVTFTRDGIFGSSGESVRFVRDSLGRLTQVIDPSGRAITYQYDAHGDLTKVTDQVGQATSYRYLTTPGHYLAEVTDPAGHPSLRVTFDEQGRIVAETDAAGNLIAHAYSLDRSTETVADRNGNVTRLVYDERGNIVSRTDPLGNTQTFTYDNNDNQLTATDARGFTIQRTFDARGNVTSITDPMGGIWRYSWNALDERVTATDPLGRTVRQVYDARGNLLQTINADGTSTSIAYDTSGRVVAITDGNGNTRSFVYAGSGPLPLEVVLPCGCLRRFEYNEVGQVTHVIDEEDNETRFTYDAVGQLLTVTDPLGGITRYTYDAAGNRTSVTDQEGRKTVNSYDEQNRLVAVTDPAGHVTRFSYDAAGNATSLTDSLGQTTRFIYDADNRVAQNIDPLGFSRYFVYDPSGNLVQLTDRNGRVRQFEYDALNREVRETWLNGAATVWTIHYGYDAVDNLLSASDPASSYVFAYDARNRVTSVDNAGTPDAPHVVLHYTYDAVGHVLSVSDDSGVRVDSVYDNHNHLASRTWQGGGVDPARIDFTTDDLGRVTGIDRFADLAGTRKVGHSVMEHDAAGRMTHLSHLDALDAVFADYDYTYDRVGQLIGETWEGETSTYGYDLSGQLLTADHAVQPDERYTYDANGNRIGAGYEVGGNNRILADGKFRYEYDREGNIIHKTEIASGNVTSFTYDHLNRLTSVVERSPGGIILKESAYTYDVFGRRIAMTVNGQTIHTVYNGDNAWADFKASGAVATRYLFGDQADEILARFRPGEGTAWYLVDHLGTVRDIVNAAGVVDHLNYDSYGRVLLETNAAFGDRFRFTGREFDVATGLYYYRARFYDPALGRFISQDPLGFQARDVNLHRYVNNGPLGATDPLGFSTEGAPYAKQVTIATYIACGSIVGGFIGLSLDPDHGEYWLGGSLFAAIVCLAGVTYINWPFEAPSSPPIGQSPGPSSPPVGPPPRASSPSPKPQPPEWQQDGNTTVKGPQGPWKGWTPKNPPQ